MRTIKFRGFCEITCEWVYGDLIHNDSFVWIRTDDGGNSPVVPESVGQFTGLYDKNGKEIYEGDILRFNDECGIWQCAVVFERGLFGLDVCHPKQIENPEDWKQTYDKVRSRWWTCEWGYEEFGTAFTYRRPLAQRTTYKGKNEDWNTSEYKAWHEKYGWEKYVVWAEIIGNIHDNPELLKGGEK